MRGMILGMLAGAAAMYMFDPEQGRTRRSFAKDKIDKYKNKATELSAKKGRDLRNRAKGAYVETSNVLQ